MIFRATVEADLDRFLPLLAADPGCGLTAGTYRARFADGEYRPAWTWIAEPAPGAAPLALAVWWGSGPDAVLPGALDAVSVHGSVRPEGERTSLAAGLLTAAHAAYAGAGAADPPEYHLFLPGDWHERPEVVAGTAWRREAAWRAGLTVGVERLRYEWTPRAGLPEPSGRVLLCAEPDDEVFVGLFRRVLEGTLDAATRRAAARIGAGAQARADVALYRDTLSGDRSWWRTARTPGGEVVGFAVPSRNHACPVVGYLGVLPEHRGRGYAVEILAETTRILATEAGARRIRADTDLANTPMAAAFERLGYRTDARRLVLSAR